MLDLAYNNIKDNGAKYFFNGLIKNKYLKYLNFGGNLITD